jgi:hypothetical protein
VLVVRPVSPDHDEPSRHRPAPHGTGPGDRARWSSWPAAIPRSLATGGSASGCETASCERSALKKPGREPRVWRTGTPKGDRLMIVDVSLRRETWSCPAARAANAVALRATATASPDVSATESRASSRLSALRKVSCLVGGQPPRFEAAARTYTLPRRVDARTGERHRSGASVVTGLGSRQTARNGSSNWPAPSAFSL